MSRIGELIAEHCPAGVPHKPVGQVFTVVSTVRGVQRSEYANGSSIPIVDQGQGLVAGFTDDEALVVGGGPYVVFGDHTRVVKWVDFKFAPGADGTKVLKSADSVLSKFGYYALASLEVASRGYNRHWTVLRDLEIPVPPLVVQREIVRVLDQFTELEAELEAELEVRRVQYEHYRKILLSPRRDIQVRQVAIDDVVRLRFGSRITKARNAGTRFPVYGGGGASFRTDAYNREDEWVVSRFAMSANCVRRVAGKFWMLDSGFTFDVIDDTVDKDFMGQMLLSMQPIIFATSTKSAQKNIDIEGFKRIPLLLPPLGEQERIVAVLDAFDTLVNDLSVGLPAELAARRKQYEYYRDKLLTFEEAPS